MPELQRKNIQITETQNQFLRRVSYETNIPEAEHIRRALDHYFTAWYGGNYEKEESPVKTKTCANCKYYGDEVEGCCGVGNEKPEPCEPTGTCSQFTE